jgi:putative redox protein
VEPVVVRQVDGRVLEVAVRDAVTRVDGSADHAEGTFRSAELLLGALGSCMAGTMMSRAGELGCAVADVRVELRQTVSTSGPLRISRIRATVTYDGSVSPEQEAELARAAHTCKIHATLEHGVPVAVEVRNVAGNVHSMSSPTSSGPDGATGS